MNGLLFLKQYLGDTLNDCVCERERGREGGVSWIIAVYNSISPLSLYQCICNCVHICLHLIYSHTIIYCMYALYIILWKRLWCNGYRPRKWTQSPEFKSWTRLLAFHITLTFLGKICNQLSSLQLRIKSRIDGTLWSCYSLWSSRRFNFMAYQPL